MNDPENLESGSTSAEIEALVGKSLRAVQENRLAEAREGLEQALRRAPDHLVALQSLGILAHNAGQSEAARHHLEMAVELAPDDAALHSNLATVLHALGEPEASLEHYHRALELEPNRADVHLGLGVVLQRLDRGDEAVEHLRRAIALAPDVPTAYARLVTISGVALSEQELAGIRGLLSKDGLDDQTRALFHDVVSRSISRDVRLAGDQVYLRAPLSDDWSEWAALRAASRSFLERWDARWPANALKKGNFEFRLQHYENEWRRGEGYSFLVFRTEDDVLLGGISISNIRRGPMQCGALGYWIGESFKQKGYMTRAMATVLDFAFDQLILNRMEAACLPDNIASYNLLARTGFTECGTIPGYIRINGAWRDHLLFSLSADDWRHRRQRAQT